ncbi:SIMPL domain-containing protein [Undibacterium jejuense]|uniref:SIMPL domain-containing protein n=1 Tax=Undibacterium jejuense TaxID=1344949 RepID=A0A923HEC4_9BURK|nr:SIMPL domain-containing protein [Undibacterium jejuense]MBC3861505.1 SIMPL domain-containing protein [Undibacterium jejuense]
MLAIVLCFHSSGLASQLPDYPFIHTTGIAYVRVTPDIGEINFDVHVSDADAEKALTVATARMAEIKSVAAQQGTQEEDIVIRDLKKEMKKDAAGANAAEPIYQLSYSVVLKIRDLKNWQAIMSPLLKLSNIDKVEASFDSTVRDKIELDLSIEAVKDAQRKASGLVGSFGKHLGAVTAMSEGKLKNLSTAIGLVNEQSTFLPEVERRQAIGEDLFVIPPLKLQSSVDVIFRIK